VNKTRIKILAGFLFVGLPVFAQTDSQWVLEQSTLTYHVSHLRGRTSRGRFFSVGLFLADIFQKLGVLGGATLVYRQLGYLVRPRGETLFAARDDHQRWRQRMGWLVSCVEADRNGRRRCSPGLGGPAARFIEGDGSVTVTSWSARRVELQTDCAACGPVMINQLYFPAWRAELLPGAQPLQVRPAMPPGLIEVRVPPGSHRVLIDIPRGRSERLGDWITAVCALMCFALYPLGRSYRWMRAASGIDHDQR
jgi:hypothetical protein